MRTTEIWKKHSNSLCHGNPEGINILQQKWQERQNEWMSDDEIGKDKKW